MGLGGTHQGGAPSLPWARGSPRPLKHPPCRGQFLGYSHPCPQQHNPPWDWVNPQTHPPPPRSPFLPGASSPQGLWAAGRRWRGALGISTPAKGKKKIKKKLQGSPRCPILPSGPRQWGLCPRTEPQPWGLCPRLGQRGGGQTPAPRPGHQLHPNIPSPPPHPVMEEEGKGPYRLPRAVRPPPPPEHTAAERGGHMLPASAPFCRSAAFDLPNSGAFKAPRRRAEAGGSGTHGSCSWGRGWGGGQGEVGGQEVDPGISIPWDPIPPHRDAASGGAK